MQNMVKLEAISNMKHQGGSEMKGNYEQMTQWVEELKNPIGNLMGRLELHQEDIALDCYHHLWENCQDLDDNVNRLVQLIRMYAGDVLPCWEFVLLTDTLEYALREKEELGRRKGVAVRSEYLRGDYKIWTDGRMLQDLVEQMLHHVIQYAERGNTIRLGFQIRSEHLVLWVGKRGAGIFLYSPSFVYDGEQQKSRHRFRDSNGTMQVLSVFIRWGTFGRVCRARRDSCRAASSDCSRIKKKLQNLKKRC